MRLKQLIKKLQKIEKECKGNPEVLFDSEAGLFPWHYVDLKDVSYLPKELTADNIAIVSISYDYNTTPCVHLTKEQQDYLKESFIKHEDYKR